MAHFQQLFDVKDMEGVFPKMSELYTFNSEMRNSLNALRDIFHLEPTASMVLIASFVTCYLCTATFAPVSDSLVFLLLMSACLVCFHV